MKSSVEFFYNERGYGDLNLYDGENLVIIYLARTGSVNIKSQLVNAIPCREWYIIKPSISSKEKGMVITPGLGWKIRLYLSLDNGFTHYLIHPDGGKGGSVGCIVIQRLDAIDLKDAIDERLKKGVITVTTKLIKGVV